MLVILTDEQILSPQKVCCNCLMADQRGLPRWRKGRLGCGHALANDATRLATRSPALYECQMGFRVADIE